MFRAPRIEYPSARYHLMNRGSLMSDAKSLSSFTSYVAWQHFSIYRANWDDLQAYKEADRSCVSTYGSVWCQLVNLRDAYVLQGIPEPFHQEVQQFMTEHSRRKALLTRLTTKEQLL